VKVFVVRCRQLLVSHPVEAVRLASLLRAGTSLERARQAVVGVAFTERSRVYLMDELDPAVRREVESLPTGGWSEPRPWRGRTLVFQVVEKGLRPRSSVPKLGQGLAPEELDRVARMVPEHVAPRIASPDSADFTPASVVKQAKPEYPRDATKAGEVTLQVTVGRVGEVVEVRRSTASDPIFEGPAMEAARRSTYRPARRNGLPEQGNVMLTFQFTPANPDLTNPR
jgi:TonB family protein